AIGRKRALHGVLLIGVMALVSVGVLAAFPPRLAGYALKIPVIYDWLAPFMPPNFTMIDHGTSGSTTISLALRRFSVGSLFVTFLLPYMGTLILVFALFAVVGRPLRVLWIASLYFLWLVITHILGSLGFCNRCMATYTPYFVATGALAAALTLAMIMRWARQR